MRKHDNRGVTSKRNNKQHIIEQIMLDTYLALHSGTNVCGPMMLLTPPHIASLASPETCQNKNVMSQTYDK